MRDLKQLNNFIRRRKPMEQREYRVVPAFGVIFAQPDDLGASRILASIVRPNQAVKRPRLTCNFPSGTERFTDPFDSGIGTAWRVQGTVRFRGNEVPLVVKCGGRPEGLQVQTLPLERKKTLVLACPGCIFVNASALTPSRLPDIARMILRHAMDESSVHAPGTPGKEKQKELFRRALAQKQAEQQNNHREEGRVVDLTGCSCGRVHQVLFVGGRRVVDAGWY